MLVPPKLSALVLTLVFDCILTDHIATYVDSKIFVGEEEEPFETIVKALEHRLGVNEEHSTHSGWVGHIACRHHSVQQKPIAERISLRTDEAEMSGVETGLTKTWRRTQHPSTVHNFTRLHHTQTTVSNHKTKQ